MSARYALDFAKVRADNPIEKVAARLGIVLKPAGNQLRGNCPSGEGDDRALVVTPAKQLWYSHPLKKGGDVLDLVALVNKLSVKEAAAWLSGNEPEVHDAIMRMYRQGAINAQRIPHVWEAYDSPPFDWGERNAWRLFNAATYVLREKVSEDPSLTRKVHDIIDGYCEPVETRQLALV